jgi:hypothetical protein
MLLVSFGDWADKTKDKENEKTPQKIKKTSNMDPTTKKDEQHGPHHQKVIILNIFPLVKRCTSI